MKSGHCSGENQGLSRGRMDLKVRLLEEENTREGGGWFSKMHLRLQGIHSADCKMNKIP